MLLEMILAASMMQAQPVDTPNASEPKSCDQLSHDLIPQMKDWKYDMFTGAGWRTLANHGCFFEAGTAIVSWMGAHQDTMTAKQDESLRYQAARVFAMAGRNDLASLHLSKAHDPDQPANAAMDWNAYVDAFAAWIDQDKLALMDAIAKLQNQPVGKDGQKPNLVAAQRFLVCYDKPYASIETDPACLDGAAAITKEQEQSTTQPVAKTN